MSTGRQVAAPKGRGEPATGIRAANPYHLFSRANRREYIRGYRRAAVRGCQREDADGAMSYSLRLRSGYALRSLAS